jgi:hypothetical protein
LLLNKYIFLPLNLVTPSEMSVQQENQQPAALQPAPTAPVKLGPFWPHAPGLWFSQAECQFTVAGLEDQFQRYCRVVSVLPHESLRLVADIVESPPAANQYDELKGRLMASHQMTSYQRAERLFAMPSLGARKPSDLMAAMLEICPRGEEKTELFACLFLQRLPRELRVLLARADHKDPKKLADEADNLWGMHVAPADQVAALSPAAEVEGTVAAMRPAADSGRGRRGRRGRGGGGNAGQRQQQEPELSRAARLAAGLCLKHWRYGEAANSCEQPCNWPGNGPAGGN